MQPNSVYRTKQTFSKATKNVLRASSKTMAQKKQVLQHISQDLGILPKPKAMRIQSKIPASARTKVKQFYL
ncbi:unnamed protein product [Rotaria socialis]|uniref:Uncharacterized protein n=1 Tax=Rotaria socialis TaxID=392032 RepID=A0A821N6U3_9BILA|nr:unnamed protein product [Rotaria socialis]CAF3372480.1 unnamed protein product [Rotaria socialis]CAF3391311.1 unnamed protein product [Rotaria socialis]CAF4497933.1 unnamed protein product [Rotaria socialis]CAF4782314.1 unnamed protein product [Rotaria socialis]